MGQNFGYRDVPTKHCGVIKLRYKLLMRYQNIGRRLFHFVIMHTSDRQTQNFNCNTKPAVKTLISVLTYIINERRVYTIEIEDRKSVYPSDFQQTFLHQYQYKAVHYSSGLTNNC